MIYILMMTLISMPPKETKKTILSISYAQGDCERLREEFSKSKPMMFVDENARLWSREIKCESIAIKDVK